MNQFSDIELIEQHRLHLNAKMDQWFELQGTKKFHEFIDEFIPSIFYQIGAESVQNGQFRPLWTMENLGLTFHEKTDNKHLYLAKILEHRVLIDLKTIPLEDLLQIHEMIDYQGKDKLKIFMEDAIINLSLQNLNQKNPVLKKI